jgi:hypothetical protein
MVNPYGNETEPLSESGGTSFGPLEAALCHLVASKRTGGPGYESGKEFSATFSALIDWAQACSFVRPKSDFPIFYRPPDAYGQEHEAWFHENAGRWLKATYPNKFGLSWGCDGSATPLEYFSRLDLQNSFFGDDIHLEAIVQCGSHIRVLTSQPHIPGEAATYAEIERWFLAWGFRKVEIGGSIAWYAIIDNLLIADAHEGNVIKTAEGVLLPIDLNIFRPEGAMLAEIQAMLTVDPD